MFLNLKVVPEAAFSSLDSSSIEKTSASYAASSDVCVPDDPSVTMAASAGKNAFRIRACVIENEKMYHFLDMS